MRWWMILISIQKIFEVFKSSDGWIVWNFQMFHELILKFSVLHKKKLMAASDPSSNFMPQFPRPRRSFCMMTEFPLNKMAEWKGKVGCFWGQPFFLATKNVLVININSGRNSNNFKLNKSNKTASEGRVKVFKTGFFFRCIFWRSS